MRFKPVLCAYLDYFFMKCILLAESINSEHAYQDFVYKKLSVEQSSISILYVFIFVYERIKR